MECEKRLKIADHFKKLGIDGSKIINDFGVDGAENLTKVEDTKTIKRV